MLIHKTALVLFSAFMITGVCASDQPQGCFTNTYDKAHLAKHKGQSITSIKMLLKDARNLENSQDDFHAEFEVTLRGQGKVKWGDVGLCRGKPGAWRCNIECDGGGFELKDDDNGLTVINSRGFRITKDGGCGEETDYVEAKPGNRLFRLSKSKLSACK
jgi:hypothetical protein